MPINLPIADPHWYRHPERACLEPDPDQEADRIAEFYELSEGKTAAARRNAAEVIAEFCNVCPLRADCLAHAMNTEQDLTDMYRFGIQGGKTPAQRASLARMLNRPIAHGTPAGRSAHRRRGEKPCHDCQEGRRAHEANRREGNVA